MRLARWSVLLALAASLALSGCLEGVGGTADVPSGIPSGAVPQGDNAGTPSSHGEPAREESAVTVTRDGSQYVARKTVTLSNDFGGASAADVTLKTVNGGASAKSWSQGGYESLVSLTGRAPTEQQARDALAKMSVVHSDKLGSGRLTLSTEVKFPSTFGQQVSGQASIVLSTPPQPSYVLILKTVNGAVSSAGLGGSSISAQTTNGAVDVAGAFNSVTAGADNGGIDLAGKANSVKASTSNGRIEASLEPTASGSYRFTTVNGGIDVELRGSGAFDVEAGCVNGGVSIDLAGGEAVGSQSGKHKHVRSTGYDAAAVKVTVDADTVNGSIDIEG